MTPPTVNAYYDDQRNDIHFPAGTLQPPYFDLQWDDAVNYGSIGATIGHEMTHGFDNAGRMFDKDGNLKDWWSRKDAKAFTERTQCLIDEYDGFRVADQLNLDGTLTLGENTADNGGTRIAYLALERLLDGKPRPLIDGYTPEQRFFIAYGQSFCENQTDAGQRLQAMTDPHAIASFRVNGVVQNMPEFAQAFACHAGQKMVSPKLCRVW
jgi:endothelin-converting enzyme/putative endopeptidase